MFILKYFKLVINNLIEKYKIANDIEFYLNKIGLEQKVIKKLLPNIIELLDLPLDISQIIQYGLKYILNNYIPAPKHHKYLFNNIKENEWVTVNNNNIYNYSKFSQLNNLTDLETIIKNVPTIIDFNKYVLYYHTTDWVSYKKIIKSIDCNYGDNCLDFGQKPSFYLNPQLLNALEWGLKKRYTSYNEIVIIIFKIPNSIFTSLDISNADFVSRNESKDNVTTRILNAQWCTTSNVKVKIFNEANREWHILTRQSRRCEENELDDCGLILGPMVANPKEVKIGSMPITHIPEKIQLACRRDAICDQLNGFIIGSIFFNKQIKINNFV